jgi:acyl carrier protein
MAGPSWWGVILVTPTLEKILRVHARFIPADSDINPEMSLESLGVDSIGMIELILQIETEFDLEIPAEQITPETFATPASIWRLLSEINPKLDQSQQS